MTIIKKLFRSSSYAYAQVFFNLVAIATFVMKIINDINMFDFLNAESYILFAVIGICLIISGLQIYSGIQRNDKGEIFVATLTALMILPFASILNVFFNLAIYLNKFGVRREENNSQTFPKDTTKNKAKKEKF
jgi:uncharacterized membrane protein